MISYRSQTAMVALVMGVVCLIGFQIPANAALTEVLGCTPVEPDGGGDRADLRGIRFTLQEDFQALELYMNTFNPGVYIFTAELRRSSGFTGDPLRTVRTSVEFSGQSQPKLVHLDFTEVQVSGSETFTLRFVDFYGPPLGRVYFEAIGGADLCAQVEETEGNTGATPQVRSNDPWLRVLGSGNPSELLLTSTYVTSPPSIDGFIGFGEWPLSNKIEFENGFLTAVHDYHRLYVLVDVLADTNEEADDYFWLAFDVNRDGEITPGADLQYGTNPFTGEMRYMIYNGPASWTGLQPETFSSMGKGFGCFFPDGTLWISINPFQVTCNSHRVWEFGIDLAEIGTRIGDMARIGLKVISNTPDIEEYIPANFTNDFTNLIEVQLVTPLIFTIYPNPTLSVSLDEGTDTDAVEINQAIQDRDNSLPLVEEKKSVARVYSQATSSLQPGIVSLYGSRNGIDLPGSPLAVFHNSPTTIVRENPQDTANFLLPTTWTRGDVTFRAVVRDLFSRVDESANIPLTFTPTRIPTYWTLPLNTGTVASPILPSDADMDAQEDFLEAIYPFPDVRFVRKPWEAIGPVSVANMIDELNYYYSVVVLAWILSGGSFDLPDQVYGIFSSGSSPSGLSDPQWGSGLGRVGRGNTANEAIMAHEIIHNLGPGDCADGMDLWGRHVSNLTSSMTNGWCIPGETTTYGCGASGADAGWQARFNDAEIHEVGIDTSVSPFRLVPADKPEVMSYCTDTVLPSSWISDYRWEQMVNHFQTAAAGRMTAMSRQALLAKIEPTIYVSGEVYRDDLGGGGQLKPALVQPGIPMTQDEVTGGIYAVELWSPEGEKPLYDLSFTASFLGDIANWDGKPRDHFPFNFRLPALQEVAEIRLTKIVEEKKVILDFIKVEEFEPTVAVLAPTRGETWDKKGTVRWRASDRDSESLSFSILYSRDEGKTWIPLAPRIEEAIRGEGDYALEVDATTLPAGSSRVVPTSLVRVIATDGYNTSQDDSEPFFVLPNPPRVSIVAPEDGHFSPEGVPVNFRGRAEDEEDDVIPTEQMIWSIVGKPFGTGAEVQAVLPCGTHDIYFTAVDSDGQEAGDSISVTVAPVCEGDFEPDGDVDGADLSRFPRLGVDLVTFAADFGKTGCLMDER